MHTYLLMQTVLGFEITNNSCMYSVHISLEQYQGSYSFYNTKNIIRIIVNNSDVFKN